MPSWAQSTHRGALCSCAWAAPGEQDTQITSEGGKGVTEKAEC